MKMTKKKLIFCIVILIVVGIIIVVGNNVIKKKTRVTQILSEEDYANDKIKKIDFKDLEITDEDVKSEESKLFNLAEMCATEDGVYYFDDNFLKFYDNKAKKSVMVCNRPNCAHTDESCDAYYEDDILKGSYNSCNLCYYEGNLYITYMDKNDNVSLYKVSKDGSSKEEVMNIYKADNTEIKEGKEICKEEMSSMEIFIASDYVYYDIESKDGFSCIKRKKLGNSDSEETLAEAKGEFYIYRMSHIGKYVFFQAGMFHDNSNLYVQNIETGEINLLKKNFQQNYFINSKEMLYGVYGEGTYRYNYETKKDELIYPIDKIENEQINQVFSSKYIFEEQLGEDVKVRDWSGKELGSLKGCTRVNYINNDILWGEADIENVDVNKEYTKFILYDIRTLKKIDEIK